MCGYPPGCHVNFIIFWTITLTLCLHNLRLFIACLTWQIIKRHLASEKISLKKKRNNETKFPISGLKSDRVIFVMTVEVDSLNNESRNTRTKQTLIINYPWNSTSLNERWKPVDLSSYFLVIFGSCFIQFSVSFAAPRIIIAVQLMTRNRKITWCCRKNYFVHLSI